MVTSLAQTVLPLIRTRTDLHRWSASNRHGHQMHAAVDALEAATPDGDPVEVYDVTHKALASAVTVIARADDSSGIIGDACRRLLRLHPGAAAAAGVRPGRLVDWMMTFQFDGDVDYFELDPVAYAPALGAAGVADYRARLEQVRARVEAGSESSDPSDPSDPSGFGSGRVAAYGHEAFTLSWNDRRLAVLDCDVEAIIRTHAGDRRVAAWFHDTARALEEIGETDLAIDWARQGVDVGPWHQSLEVAATWCRLLREHHPDEVLAAHVAVFRRWPTSTTATRLHAGAGDAWPRYQDEVLSALAARPSEAVGFVLRTLQEPQQAWDLAHSLQLQDDHTWDQLATAYEQHAPSAVLAVHTRLVIHELVEANARRYRAAAARLARMRTLSAALGDTAEGDEGAEVDALIRDLRHTHRNRPRLQQEFDRAGLP